MGLNIGADDYITKPFVISEVIARVKAVLRRTGVSQPGYDTTRYVSSNMTRIVTPPVQPQYHQPAVAPQHNANEHHEPDIVFKGLRLKPQHKVMHYRWRTCASYKERAGYRYLFPDSP